MRDLARQFIDGLKAYLFCFKHSKALWRVTAEESKGRHMPRAAQSRTGSKHEPFDFEGRGNERAKSPE